MIVQEKLFTANDLWHMADDGKIHELHNGVLIELAGSGERQSALAIWIAYLLTRFIMDNTLGGMVTGADGSFVLSPFNTRIPDVAYLTAANARNEQTFHKGAPDLAVEVVSPSNKPLEMQQRAGEYLNAGSRLVWIVDPDQKTIDVYRADGSRTVLHQGDPVEGYEVLPGLALSITTLFSPYGQAL